MKNFIRLLGVAVLCFSAAALVSCGGNTTDEGNTQMNNTYVQISAEEAKALMDSETDYVIIDARTQEEYDAGHIPGAVLMPEYEVAQRAEKELADKNQLILVYCRSGRRSKIAAKALTDLGYTKVREFGGIIDWEYETVK